MKTLLITLALLLFCTVYAQAACPSPTNGLAIKDANSATQNLSVVADANSNCQSNTSALAGAMVDGWDVTKGTKADPAYNGSGSASLVSIQKGIYTSITGPLGAQGNTTTNIGNVGQASGDPCTVVAHQFTPINITALGSTQVIAGTAAKKTYICFITREAQTVDDVALIEGTGTNCGTGTAGMEGGTTAASGFALPNGNLVQGTGANAVFATATVADNICLITSSTAQLSGNIVWVQQ